MKNLIIAALGGWLVFQGSTSAVAQTNNDVAESIVESMMARGDSKTSQPYSSLADLRQIALGLVNRDRRQQGLPELVHHPLLDQVAQAHAEDMIRQNYFSHYSKDGRTPMERVRAAGSTMSAGENILSYQLGTYKPSRPELISTFQSMFYKSASHREIMMRSKYAHFGYGFAATAHGRIVAVQLFGSQ